MENTTTTTTPAPAVEVIGESTRRWKGGHGWDIRLLGFERWSIEARGTSGTDGGPLYGVRDNDNGRRVVASFYTRDQLIGFMIGKGAPLDLLEAALR